MFFSKSRSCLPYLQPQEEQNNQKMIGSTGSLHHKNEIQPSTTSEIKGLLSSPSQMKSNGLKSNHSSDQDPKGLNVQLEAVLNKEFRIKTSIMGPDKDDNKECAGYDCFYRDDNNDSVITMIVMLIFTCE